MVERRVQTMQDDLKNVEFETSEEVDVTPTFDGMGLREDLLRGIYAYGRLNCQVFTTIRVQSYEFCNFFHYRSQSKSHKNSQVKRL